MIDVKIKLKLEDEDAEVKAAATCASSNIETLLRTASLSESQRLVLEKALVVLTRIVAEIGRPQSCSEEEQIEVVREVACAWEDLLQVLSLSSPDYLTPARLETLQMAHEVLEEMWNQLKPMNLPSDLVEFQEMIDKINATISEA